MATLRELLGDLLPAATRVAGDPGDLDRDATWVRLVRARRALSTGRR